MKRLLPQVFPRDLCSVAVIAVVSALLSSPATAQDITQYDLHNHLGKRAEAGLRIEIHVVPYCMAPPKRHDDRDDAAVVYGIPSRQPAMSVSEEERPVMGMVNLGSTMIEAGPGALLRTTTVVPE